MWFTMMIVVLTWLALDRRRIRKFDACIESGGASGDRKWVASPASYARTVIGEGCRWIQSRAETCA